MINVIITSDPRYKINKAAIEAAALGVLQRNNVTSSIELEVSIVGDRKMHELNKKYRGIDSTTDILSFALEDPNPQPEVQLASGINPYRRAGFIAAPDKVLRLGSIIISHPQAVEDAGLDNRSVEDEISFLVDHGTKHLLGIHHPVH